MTADPHIETLRQWMCLDPRADWEAEPEEFAKAVEALDALAARLEAAERDRDTLLRKIREMHKPEADCGDQCWICWFQKDALAGREGSDDA